MKKALYPPHPVLLVDDEEQFLASAGFILKGAGISNIVTCSDSLQVMSLLRGQRFSAVFLDLSIPHLSGSELLEEIGKNFPGIPVIIVTALNDEETAAQCLEKGAAAYLVKPLHSQVFIDVVKFFASGPSARRIASRAAEGPSDHLEGFLTRNNQSEDFLLPLTSN